MRYEEPIMEVTRIEPIDIVTTSDGYFNTPPMDVSKYEE